MDEELVNVELILVLGTTAGEAVQLALRTYAALSLDKLGMEVPETAIGDVAAEAMVVGVNEDTPTALEQIVNGPASK